MFLYSFPLEIIPLICSNSECMAPNCADIFFRPYSNNLLVKGIKSYFINCKNEGNYTRNSGVAKSIFRNQSNWTGKEILNHKDKPLFSVSFRYMEYFFHFFSKFVIILKCAFEIWWNFIQISNDGKQIWMYTLISMFSFRHIERVFLNYTFSIYSAFDVKVKNKFNQTKLRYKI